MSGRLEQLEALIKVVEHQGFAPAADRLNLARSVISRRVKELEKRLGVRLLNRTTRRVSLTAAGEEYYRRANSVLLELDDMEQSISEQQLELSGKLRIAAPLSFGYRHLSQALSEFIQSHPDIELEMDLNDRQIDLVAEGYDLAIRIGELRDSSLIAFQLGKIPFVTVASPEYLEIHGSPAYPDELLQHDGLYYSHISPRSEWLFLADGQKRVYKPRVRLRANNGDILARAAINGLGIYQCPTFIVDEWLRNGDLVRILTEYTFQETQVNAVFPPGRMIPRRARALMEYLRQKFGDNPPWADCC
jgi:DNA-binding transcriptional LysR family regulator